MLAECASMGTCHTRHRPNTVYIRSCMYLFLRIYAGSNQYFNNTICHHSHCLLPCCIPSTPPSPLPKVPEMYSPLWMESRVDCFLWRWKRSQSGSGECMETNIKCENCNEALCFILKQNGFYGYHHMWSILIYSGGIWQDCGFVMCNSRVGPSMGPHPVTSREKTTRTSHKSTHSIRLPPCSMVITIWAAPQTDNHLLNNCAKFSTIQSLSMLSWSWKTLKFSKGHQVV